MKSLLVMALAVLGYSVTPEAMEIHIDYDIDIYCAGDIAASYSDSSRSDDSRTCEVDVDSRVEIPAGK